ncbi:MAG: RyR domain-containing protein [Muribaculaceae bacterium]
MQDLIMDNIYNPKPVDTTDVVLPAELMPLMEEMAKNVHEVWANNRIAEGWRYGPVRDDAQKKHPCLIPYEQLPESEKDYDRATSLETLKLIIKSGFTIIKK